MQMSEKTKRIILFILGSIVIILIILLVMKNFSTKEYVVTFDTNGGGNVSTLTIEKNGKVTKPADPVKEGYVFDGWYYNNKKFDFNTEITQDMKLEARWIPVEATGISLNAQSLTLKPDGTAELKVIFTPDGASSELTWKSSDEKIVTVSEDGKLKALKEGEATITVTTTNGKYKAECKVSVKKDAVAVTSVSISGDKEVTVGNTIKLTANIKPKDASNKDVVWKSNDKKIATVDSKGNVKGVKAGKVKITVTTVDGEKEAKIEITVKDKSTSNPSTETPSNPTTPNDSGSTTPSTGDTEQSNNIPVKGITINEGETLSLEEGATKQLTYTLNPSNATNKEVSWESDNDAVSVDSKGKIIANKVGTAKVTVTTKDGSHKDKITITVTEKEAKYSMYFKREKEMGEIVSYIMTIKKNNANLPSNEEFCYIIYNNLQRKWKLNISAGVPKPSVDETINTAKIVVKVDGVEKTFPVEIVYGD